MNDRFGLRPLTSLSREWPLTGAKQTPKTLEILDSDFRFRPGADILVGQNHGVDDRANTALDNQRLPFGGHGFSRSH